MRSQVFSSHTALVALASFGTGCATAVAHHIVSRKIARYVGRLHAIAQMTAFMAIYGAGGVLLLHLAAPNRALAPVIAIAWAVGIGAVRSYLREI